MTMRRILILVLPLAAPASVPGQPSPAPVVPATRSAPAALPPLKARHPDKLPDAAQPIYFSALRATEWLKLASKRDGRFVYGFQPSLAVPLDGDNFQSQAGAAFALARASRYFGDAGAAAKASQAALSLLLETVTDPADPNLRHTAAAPEIVNRLISHGLYLSAVHELASPPADLVQAADQMANYLKSQQQPNGSLVVKVGPKAHSAGSSDADAEAAGWALQGIICSHQRRPAPWKLDVLRSARAHYVPQWQTKKDLRSICSHTPAYAEAYLLTKDAVFAEAVFTANDWLLGLQYREEFDLNRKSWIGGFPTRREGGRVAPDIESALVAESLAEACRVARSAGDLPRLQRYERALISCLHFVMSMQYTGKRTEHFVASFRPSILGAFHASHQDGSICLDHAQHSLCAMVRYLDAVVD